MDFCTALRGRKFLVAQGAERSKTLPSMGLELLAVGLARLR
jgi:hypothetical protein